MNYLVILLVPTFYFLMSWSFPWDKFQFNSTVSVAYIFDALFGVSVLYAFKKKEVIGKLSLVGSAIRSLAIASCGAACVYAIIVTGLNSPFRFIEHPILQLLIFAPILEELVFRGAFFETFQKMRLRGEVAHSLNTILFSFSHITGLWFLPSEFHSFIVFQMFYTLLLGWVCTKSREKTGGVVEPIILHFIFNLVFYIGVVKFGI